MIKTPFQEMLADNILSSLAGCESDDELTWKIDFFLFGAAISSTGHEVEIDALNVLNYKDDPTYGDWIKHLNRFASYQSRWRITRAALIGPFSEHVND